MKKTSLFLAVALSALTFTHCTQGPTKEELLANNDNLQREVIKKDSALYAIANAFNSIENNLMAIKEKENIIALTVSDTENSQNREERINGDIQMIYNMMLQNREKIADLQNKLKKANANNKEMQKLIASLEEKIKEKDAEILRLTQELEASNLEISNLNTLVSSLNNSIDSLRYESELQAATIEGQDEALNTAYYIIGSEKELKDMGVLDKKGKFAVGSKKTIKDFEKDAFTKIDIRETTKFDLNGAKKARVVTAHPLDSYKIYGEKPVDSLVVSNFYNFWSSSKYLVIIVQ